MSYKTIQLPKEFVMEWIDPSVQDKKNGFTSRAHFVTEAVKAFKKENDESKNLEDSK